MRRPTQVDLDGIAELILTWVQAVWDHDGEVEPTLMMLWLGEREGSVANHELVPMDLVRVFHDSAASKDVMMQFVVSMLTMPPPSGLKNPDTVVQISEAWIIANEDAKNHNPKDSVSKHPNRREVISMLFHTTFATTTMMVSIDAKTRALSQLVMPGKINGTLQGRFQVAEWMNVPSPEAKH